MDDLDEVSRRAEMAALRLQFALVRMGVRELKYSSDQPRAPAGSPEGGRWTDGEDRSAAFDNGLAGSPTLDDGLWRPSSDTELIPVAAKPPPQVDLRREELQGGHTLERAHVAASNGTLIKALEAEKLDLPASSIYLTAHGSYDSIGAANAYTNDGVQSYPDEVAQVASGKEPDAFLLKRSQSNLARVIPDDGDRELGHRDQDNIRGRRLHQTFRDGKGTRSEDVVPQQLGGRK